MVDPINAAKFAGVQLARASRKDDPNNSGGGCCGCLCFLILAFIAFGAGNLWH